MRLNDATRTVPFRVLLGLVLLFLYAPVIYIVLVSFNQDTLFIFPYEFTVEHYLVLLETGQYHSALRNSLVIATGTGIVAMVLGSCGAWAVTRYEFQGRYIAMGVFVLPLVVPTLITALSGSLVMSRIYRIPSGVTASVMLQTVHGISFSFLIMLTQLSRYPKELDEAARTYGASHLQRMREVTLPIIWPGLLGAFLLPFLLAFNNFDITFFTIGADSALPTVTWGQLRHGIRPALFALSTVIVLLTFAGILVIHVLGRFIWTDEAEA